MIGTLLVAALLFTQAPTAPPPAPVATAPVVPALSELHKTQVEAHLLRLRVLQLEVERQQAAIMEQRATLDRTISAAHPGHQMDWATGTLVVTPAAPTKGGTP